MNFLRFNDFLNEAEVRYSIERLQLNDYNWKSDEDTKTKFIAKNEDAKNVNVFVTKDEDRDTKYILITWEEGIFLNFVLRENGIDIISNSYPEDERRNFDQDCKLIIGKIIK